MIDLDDSIMITEYDNYLDLTFNDGEVVRLCRCTAEKFPELFAIQLGGTPDQITLGEPVELHVFFSTLGNDGYFPRFAAMCARRLPISTNHCPPRFLATITPSSHHLRTFS
jgi:hypothetical protein